MLENILAVCATLLLCTVSGPDSDVAGDEVRVSTAISHDADGRGAACAEAEQGARNIYPEASIGSCDCESDDGSWTCTVTYTVRRPD